MENENNGEEHYLGTFLCFDYTGRSTELEAMKSHRCVLSLSGLPTDLIALGGTHESAVTSASEKYSLSRNKWSELPRLNLARAIPGSVLLPSMRAFCFCGINGQELNSVERLELESEIEWQMLPLSENIAKIAHIAAALYESKIVIFGGFLGGLGGHCYQISEEGEVVKDLS